MTSTSSSSLDALDIARAYMRAWNRRDQEALVAAYHPDALVELFAPVAADGEPWRGHEAIARGFAALFQTFEGALAGGLFFDVRTVARIETGWTHVEWLASLHARDGAAAPSDGAGIDGASIDGGTVSGITSATLREPQGYAGYFHFRVRDGLIVEQRAVAHAVAAAVASASGSTEVADAPLAGAPAHVDTQGNAGSGDGPPARSSRLYPSRPIVGVGAVIIVDGQVVLIKRKYEPLAGQWSLPGGSLEVGETLEAGVAREMLEETGLHVEVGPVIEVFDRILLDAERRVRYHFVLIDYLCLSRGGELRANSDVADARLVAPDALAPYRLTPKADEVIRKAFARWKEMVASATDATGSAGQG